MTDPKELIAWLQTLSGGVAVDDGGLMLVEVDLEDGEPTDACFEVGGVPLPNEWTMDEIKAFLDDMSRNEKYDDTDGFHYWLMPDGLKTPSGTCTNGAILVAKEFGGVVYGYQLDARHTDMIGGTEGGHDFALINDRYLVDWWAVHVGDRSRNVYDLMDPYDAAEVELLYRPRADWCQVWGTKDEAKASEQTPSGTAAGAS